MAGKYTEVQGNQFAIVLEQIDTKKNYSLPVSFLRSQLRAYARKENFSYWAILHDFDVDEEGNPKRNHYHVVVKYPTRHRIGAIIKKFGFMMNLNDNCVSVIKCTDLDRDIRYLIHLDEDGLKTPYPADDVITNDEKRLQDALTLVVKDYDVDKVQEVIMRCGFDRAKIIKEMGFKDYMRWRGIISDMIRDIRGL